jgi:hypothetical protein
MGLNKENESIKNHTGLIKQLQTEIKNTVARVKKLEEQLRKIAQISVQQPSVFEFQGIQDALTRVSGVEGAPSVGQTGELTDAQKAEIKELVSQWLSNGDLPISLHDHTDTTKGGDAYANKGAALQ